MEVTTHQTTSLLHSSTSHLPPGDRFEGDLFLKEDIKDIVTDVSVLLLLLFCQVSLVDEVQSTSLAPGVEPILDPVKSLSHDPARRTQDGRGQQEVVEGRAGGVDRAQEGHIPKSGMQVGFEAETQEEETQTKACQAGRT